MGDITVNVDSAADLAFEKFMTDLQAANPELMSDPRLQLRQNAFREMLRTAFYLGFSAGEDNALSKIQS